MFKKSLVAALSFSFCYTANAEIQAHDLTITKCRAFSSKDLQIVGLAAANDEKSIMFSNTSLGEKVVDRYLSLCLTSLASGAKLRVDYLDCTATGCVVTANTSLSSNKP